MWTPKIYLKHTKEELFVTGFYYSFIAVMMVATIIDLFIKNYIDVIFELLFAFLGWVGLFYFFKSKNINHAKWILSGMSTIGSYIFFVTSGFLTPVFISIVSLSYFLLFPISIALSYNLFHQLTVAGLYIYGYNMYPDNPIVHQYSSIMSTFMASLLMIFLGVIYQLSIENSYQRLYSSNKEKEILLQELNHRVKNNLQIILSIIQLQSYKSKEKAIFHELENRINAIANIYEILVVNDNIQEINMNEYINMLLFNIQKGFLGKENILYKIDTTIKLPLKEASYIGLIINELVTNAYKYAFKDKDNGFIEILLHKDKKNYILNIKDSSKGFDFENSKKSLGLELVNAIVKEQLGGTISYNAKESLYHIEFKE